MCQDNISIKIQWDRKMLRNINQSMSMILHLFSAAKYSVALSWFKLTTASRLPSLEYPGTELKHPGEKLYSPG